MENRSVPMHGRDGATNRGEGASDVVDLIGLFGTLWRGKWWIALCGLIALALGMGYANYFVTPRYTASAVVMLDSRQETVIDFESVVSGLAGDQASINTEVAVLQSRELIEKLVRNMDLTQDPAFNVALRPDPAFSLAGVKDFVLGRSEKVQLSERALMDATIDAVLRVISVSNGRQSYVFTITVVTSNPDKSAEIASTLGELYIRSQLDAKFAATEQATAWLSERVTDLQADLERAEAEVKTFSSSTDLVSAEALEQLNRQIKDVRDRLSGVRVVEAAAKARLDSLEAAKATRDAQQMALAADDTVLSRLWTSQGAGDAFDARFDLVLQRAKLELSRAEAQVMSLEESLMKLDAQYVGQSNDLVRLQQLQREAEASRLIYEYFLGRLKETAVQEGIQQADSRFLSRAAVPRSPSSPRTKRILVLATLLGLVVGATIITIREMLHNGFRSAEQLEAASGYAVMGQIPSIAVRKGRRNVIQYLVDKPTSAAAEAVRNLRTSVLLSNVDNPPKVIMVTSSLPKEGKTTVSLGLAQNFVGMGRKVLLLEGDIRRRVFSQYFDLKDDAGLLSVLSGDKTFDEVLQRDDVFGADVIVGEKSTTNAADVFSSERFREFLKEARERYDIVIIDTPPVLVVPDARVIAGLVDATLYVVRWDATARSQVRDGLRQFEMGGIQVTGLALSQIDPKGMKRYGYGGSYGAYAAYGKGYYNIS